jgi:hypothetical protein
VHWHVWGLRVSRDSELDARSKPTANFQSWSGANSTWYRTPPHKHPPVIVLGIGGDIAVGTARQMCKRYRSILAKDSSLKIHSMKKKVHNHSVWQQIFLPWHALQGINHASRSRPGHWIGWRQLQACCFHDYPALLTSPESTPVKCWWWTKETFDRVEVHNRHSLANLLSCLPLVATTLTMSDFLGCLMPKACFLRQVPVKLTFFGVNSRT